MNSNNRIAATLFPRDIVFLRNMSINNLHKGDDDDDDDDNNNNNNNKKKGKKKRTKKKNATSTCKHFRAELTKPNILAYQYEI
jgi:hypothetical protein